MKNLDNVSIQILKGKYHLVISDYNVGYSYSLGLINEWRGKDFIQVENSNTELIMGKEGIYVLAVSFNGETDTAIILYLPTLKKCREYMINMITCGNNKCAPRHDCSNCEDQNNKWYRMLSEAITYYDYLKRVVDNISLLEDEDIESRIFNVGNKIVSLTRSCQMCVRCGETKKVIPVKSIKKISTCKPCGGK